MSGGDTDVNNGVRESSEFQEPDEAQPNEVVGNENDFGTDLGEKKEAAEIAGVSELSDSAVEKEEAAPSNNDLANEIQDPQENKLNNEEVEQIIITSIGGTPVTLSNLDQVSQITSEQAEVTQITGLPPGVSLIQADQGQDGEGAIFLLVTGPVDGEGGTANAIAVDAATAAAMASLQNPLDAVSAGQPISIEELATVVTSTAVKNPEDPVAEILSNLTNERVSTSNDESAVVQVAATAEAQAAATGKAYPSPSEVSLAQDILALASSALSSSSAEAKATERTSTNEQQDVKTDLIEELKSEDDGKPAWAFLLHDFQKIGESYFGYVMNEAEMDQVLNSYKKETNSLFAIRQTPSPVKEENGTVRLMWKSQHVPYDGVPFINIGRRATVMECEHGPRKKTNALKRMFNSSPVDKASLKNVVNLTCPARIFIKKVRKFPEFKVESTTDPKILRTHQEQSLKQLRELGMSTWTGGEVRLYMQLPDAGGHRYHMTPATTPNHLETENDTNDYKTDIDTRVVTKIKEIVRQGAHSPFVVRQIARHYVDKEMTTIGGEKIPKHNKSFYPSMIEIQNLSQQIQADLLSGTLTPLPTPADGFPQSKPKKRRSSMKGFGEPINKKPATNGDSVDIKNETGEEGELEGGADGQTIGTFSLTLPEGQLENFSIANLNMEQLQQLAKIGLLALNNATTGKTSTVPTATATVTESGMIEIEAAVSQAESTSSVETSEHIPHEAVVLLTSSAVNDQVTSSEAEQAVQAIDAVPIATSTIKEADASSSVATTHEDELPSMVVAAADTHEAQPSITTTSSDDIQNDDSAVASAEATTTTENTEIESMDTE